MLHDTISEIIYRNLQFAWLLILAVSLLPACHKARSDQALASVNGVEIKKSALLEKMHAAADLGLKNTEKELQQKVLEEMINEELLRQEAVKIFADLPVKTAMQKLLEREVKQKVNLAANATRLERKKAELARFREYLQLLRAKAIIIRY